LEKFPGKTIAFVDNEAMSAGAFISAVCDEIWFVTPHRGDHRGRRPGAGHRPGRRRHDEGEARELPEGADAGDLEGKGYRGEVISAMIDADMELKITARRSRSTASRSRRRGRSFRSRRRRRCIPVRDAAAAPARRRRGQGPRRPPRKVLRRRARLHVTGLTGDLVRGPGRVPQPPGARAAGARHLALFIGFKSQGFGGFIASGSALLTVVFLSSYVSGLSGHEPVIVFSIGLVLLLLEILFFHSAGFSGSSASSS
jgi:membrane-bound serine protease (ClpP class)